MLAVDAGADGTAVTVEVTNSGAGTAVAAVLELVADGPAALDGGADCDADGDALTCELGDLAPAASVEVEVTVTPDGDEPVEVTATATSGVVAATDTVTIEPLDGPGGGDGPADVDSDDVIAAAIAISQQRFDDAGTRGAATGLAAHVVVARTGVYADALGGSVLTGDAPLLFTNPDTLHPDTATEINRVLGGAGTVYLLGGDAALTPAVADTLTSAGYTVQRLAGPSRVETALAVADTAAALYGAPATILLARANSPEDNPTAAWVDSVTAGGYAADSGEPIVLTQTEALHPAVADWLTDHRGDAAVTALGGAAALSDTTVAAVPGATRVSGDNRFATAAAIATQLWDDDGAAFLIANGVHPDGWAFALAAAGLAADHDQPLLLVEDDRVPDETSALLCTTPTPATTTIIGGPTLITQPVRDLLNTPCA